ncbi:MAG: MFS transporter [Prevotellaceae bacterium]|jgi:MFS family permease|nr:MFS transporter [Prevotellaceae bacterium]
MKTENRNPFNRTTVFIAACIGMCFFGISVITLGSLLPSLVAKLQLTGSLQTTTLATLLPLGMLGGSLLFGPIVDRYGHKALFLVSCCAVLLGLQGLAYFATILPLQLSIVLIGLGGGVLNGETNALVADIYDEADKGSRISLLGTFYGIGALGIPTLLSLLMAHYSFEHILQGIGAVMLAAVLFCATVRFPAPKQPQGFPIKEGLGLLKEKMLLLLSFILFFQSGVEGVSNNWTNLYLTQTSTALSAEQILMVLAGMMAGLTVARLALTLLFKHIRQEIILQVSLLVAALGFVLMSLTATFLPVLAGMVLVGVGLAATFPVVLGSIGSRYPTLSGTAFSVALVIALLGQTFLNALTGWLSQSVGIEVYPYITIVSLLIMWLLYRRQLTQ